MEGDWAKTPIWTSQREEIKNILGVFYEGGTSMTRIYGYSDDNIELEGDINDEIGCYDQIVTLKDSIHENGGCYCKECINFHKYED